MKKRPYIYVTLILVAIVASFAFIQRDHEPWKASQLIAPSELAHTLQTASSRQFIVYSIGPGAVIKNSIDIGPTQQEENLQKLEAQVRSLPKDAPIVIYCGCCPFNKCPNIRPAFTLLNNLHFTNHKLLNIPQNIKANWIDQGYPIAE
jgi:hypothetical protein